MQTRYAKKQKASRRTSCHLAKQRVHECFHILLFTLTYIFCHPPRSFSLLRPASLRCRNKRTAACSASTTENTLRASTCSAAHWHQGNTLIGRFMRISWPTGRRQELLITYNTHTHTHTHTHTEVLIAKSGRLLTLTRHSSETQSSFAFWLQMKRV